jgi:hypothetical protein
MKAVSQGDAMSGEKRISVSITVGDRRVVLEGPESFVREEVERFAGLRTADAQATGERLESASSERALIAQKKPQGHHEIVAVLAFWLHQSGKAEFSAEDLRKSYLRAGVRPPKVPAQALRDAKNKFDYIEPGSRPGRYRLSDHGDRVVRFDLPRTHSRD